uniref:Peptidase M10 metallopeptidase domain-containing protein n=2 Tax=Clastoptera arizonana TaxID=38151 RepID=A0A1B6DEQ4_9HEMI
MNPYYRRPSSSTFNLGYDDILGMYELYIKSPLPEDTNNKETFENESDHDRDEENTSVTNKMTTTSTSTTPRSKITFEGDDESVDVHKHHDKKHNIPGSGGPFSPDFSPTPSDKSPDGCSGNFDAVSVLRGELFVLKDKWLWRLSEPGKILPSYPVKLNRMLHRFPSSVKKIDAVYEREDDSNMVFFTGKRYWVFDGNDFIENSPKLITELGLPEYLTHIDAAMVWSKNKKTYFFSGDQYWRYNETTRIMDNGYPQSISRFRGVPEGLDSAFTWIDGTTYFFKDKDYWEFNNTWQVTEDGFPKSATKYLLNCPY